MFSNTDLKRLLVPLIVEQVLMGIIATVALFLASDMSSYCDGIVVECSGGKFLAQDCDTAWTQMR